jgi:hypothetical protein
LSEFDLNQSAVREGMVDVYVARGLLKRRGAAPRHSHTEKPSLTGAPLVHAFMQINPGRVKAVASSI